MMITQFLSNKVNLYGLLIICYLLMGVMFSHQLTLLQTISAIVVIVLSNIIWYTLGMSRGILITEIRNNNWRDLLSKSIDKDKNKNNKK